MADDYTRDLELANVPLEYLYGPIVTGFSVLSSILIAVTFLKPSMVSPTTILLTGITISRSISSLLLYGTYVYKYFAYPKQDIVYVLQYPYCIVAFVCALLKVICSSFSNCLMLFVAAQRVLVVKWPFQSRRILTNRLSCIALLLSGVILLASKFLWSSAKVQSSWPLSHTLKWGDWMLVITFTAIITITTIITMMMNTSPI